MKYAINTISKSIAICVLGMTSIGAFAQDAENLVPNGSFESTDKEPKKIGSIENAVGWYSPTGARADLFVPSKKVPDIDVPLNIYGKEDAKDGSNYAGIVAFSYGDKMARTYLSAKLSVPMKKGTKYCVQFNVSLAEGSKYSCNQIGMNIGKKAFGTEEKTSIIDKANILHPSNKIFNAAYNWEQVCETYEAEGGEKFITIGNFSSNEDTKNERNKKLTDIKVDQIIAAYYYIDNVSITLIDDKHTCNCAPEEDDSQYSKTIYQRVAKTNDKMTAAQIIEAQGVYFGFGKNYLSTAAEEALNLIAEKMKATPEMKLQVKGYSDVLEDEAGVEKSDYAGMDSKRVNAVILYLTEKGIAENRLIGSPQGSTEKSTEIIETDEDDIKQAKNRRVEFKVR